MGDNVLNPEKATELDRLKKEYFAAEADTKALFGRDPHSPELSPASTRPAPKVRGPYKKRTVA